MIVDDSLRAETVEQLSLDLIAWEEAREEAAAKMKWSGQLSARAPRQPGRARSIDQLSRWLLEWEERGERRAFMGAARMVARAIATTVEFIRCPGTSEQLAHAERGLIAALASLLPGRHSPPHH